jgi:hypothetical protein
MTEQRKPIKEERTFNVRTALRWLLALVVVVLVITLIGYARGEEHHRGDDVGALPAGVAARR